MNPVLPYLKQLIRLRLARLHTGLVRWTRPFTPSLLLLTIADLGRSKSELMAENALLRQQLIILKRQVKRPARPSQEARSGQPLCTITQHRSGLATLCRSPISSFSTALCLLPHRTQVTHGDPHGSDTISDRCLGRATPTRSHAIWASTEVSDVRS